MTVFIVQKIKASTFEGYSTNAKLSEDQMSSHLSVTLFSVIWLCHFKAPFTRIRICLNPQLFLSGLINFQVHTYPAYDKIWTRLDWQNMDLWIRKGFFRRFYRIWIWQTWLAPKSTSANTWKREETANFLIDVATIEKPGHWHGCNNHSNVN